MRPRINSPRREKSKKDSESKANSKLEYIQEVEVMAQCEKERREHGRLANKLSRSERAIVYLHKASEQEHKISLKTNLSEDQDGESVQHENKCHRAWEGNEKPEDSGKHIVAGIKQCSPAYPHKQEE